MSSTSNFLLLILLSIFLISVSQIMGFQVSSSTSSSSSSSNVKIEAQTQPQVVKGPNRRLTFVDCGNLCTARCGKHSRPNVCTRACGTCCQRCNCVPPGTHGNREVCGSCYTDMLTHGNKPKCP